MRSVGLHFRVQDSLGALARQAVASKVPYFQFFLMPYRSHTYFDFAESDVRNFVTNVSASARKWFVHGSYFINLASDNTYATGKMLQRELSYACALQARHFILHLGSHTRGKTRLDGIDSVARVLNKVTKRLVDCTIVLENTAHANRSVGSDFNDFTLLLEKLQHPEKVQFCIDTAHAFAYGYDIKYKKGYNSFMAKVKETIGFERIALIHLNDIRSECGSFIDHHYITGSGVIGKRALKRFIVDEHVSHVPCVLELPNIPIEQQLAVVHDVDSWRG